MKYKKHYDNALRNNERSEKRRKIRQLFGSKLNSDQMDLWNLILGSQDLNDKID